MTLEEAFNVVVKLRQYKHIEEVKVIHSGQLACYTVQIRSKDKYYNITSAKVMKWKDGVEGYRSTYIGKHPRR